MAVCVGQGLPCAIFYVCSCAMCFDVTVLFLYDNQVFLCVYCFYLYLYLFPDMAVGSCCGCGGIGVGRGWRKVSGPGLGSGLKALYHRTKLWALCYSANFLVIVSYCIGCVWLWNFLICNSNINTSPFFLLFSSCQYYERLIVIVSG